LKLLWNPLKRPHDIITQVAHRTSGKPRKIIVQNRVVNPHKILKRSERVSHLSPLKDFAILKNFKILSSASEEVRGPGAQETVASPFLASLHAFEKKGGLSIVDFPKGRDGCLQVIVNFVKYGNKVALGRQMFKIG
jgi:hypothetical protein